MKPIKAFAAEKPYSLVVLFISLFFLTQCEYVAKVDQQTDEYPKINTFIPLDNISHLSGSVQIRLEAFGSIRAKVYAMGEQQFEYILDREKPQDLLKENIEKAEVHLLRMGKNSCIVVGIAIDDLTTGTRYVLEPGKSGLASQKTKEITSIAKQTVLIKGYSASCNQSRMRFEDAL